LVNSWLKTVKQFRQNVSGCITRFTTGRDGSSDVQRSHRVDGKGQIVP